LTKGRNLAIIIPDIGSEVFMNVIEIYKKFPTQETCLAHLEKVKWNNKPKCPYCGSYKTSSMLNEYRHHCNSCNTSFKVTVGTIFHNTKVVLHKWFVAVSIVLNAKKGISARQLACDIQVNKNTAWYMLMRIRESMKDNSELFSGIVEIDETYIGGKNINLFDLTIQRSVGV
jgi:transposase-like protein